MRAESSKDGRVQDRIESSRKTIERAQNTIQQNDVVLKRRQEEKARRKRAKH